jgi:hypothetical protein
MDIPMLDEEEWALVHAAHEAQIRLGRDGRPAALAEYERLTGFKETVFGAMCEHRISFHGPPCPRCGKVLRTALASKCFECGFQVKQRDGE